MAQRLRQEQERAAAQAKAEREAAACLQAERQLFSRSVGPITPLRSPNCAAMASEPAPPLPMQHWQDEEQVLQESISDDFDVSTLLDTDDQLSFRRPGIGVEVTRRLRAGHWSIQRQLDLHGLRTDEAREALGQFIRHAHKRACAACVWCMAGAGLARPHAGAQKPGAALAGAKARGPGFVQARPAEGGARCAGGAAAACGAAPPLMARPQAAGSGAMRCRSSRSRALKPFVRCECNPVVEPSHSASEPVPSLQRSSVYR